jgi:hypothetical protein
MPRTRLHRLLRRILWTFCRAWLFCGLATIAAACGFGAYTSVWFYRSASIEGTIVGLSVVSNQEDSTINYAPSFTFKAEDGRTYTVMSSVATNPPGFEVGQTVRVLYLRTDPASAKLNSFWQIWFVTMLCAGLGAFFTGAGYLLLRYERRLNRRENSIPSDSAVFPTVS